MIFLLTLIVIDPVRRLCISYTSLADNVKLLLTGLVGTLFLLVGRARSEMDEGRAGARARPPFHDPF